MASSPTNNQRRREELELLALFDPDCPQDLSIFANASFSMTNPLSSNKFLGLDENVNVESWTMNFDKDTMAYLEEIIAADKASSQPPCARPASSGNDSTFSYPRKFKCPMCPKEFYCNTALRRHGCRHILKLIKCPCGFKGHSLVQKQKHFFYHHAGVSKNKFLASF